MKEPPPSAAPRYVLITGCSTGIGEACALDLDARGFRVLAGVRKEEDAQRLRQRASPRLNTLLIDVTDGAAIDAAADSVAHRVGDLGLWGLVNNAGIVVPGPLELLEPDAIRRQLEVNVLGQVALTQAMLPLLRRAAGRIVMMGSISGRIAPPYMGAYAASKHALEAIVDSLRVELRTWGIQVALVEPDSVKTPIWDKMLDDAGRLGDRLPPDVRALYGREMERMHAATSRLDRSGMSVAHVVRAVRHAVEARRPRTRYPVGWRTRLGFATLPSLPGRIRDWVVLRLMGIE